MGNFNDFPPRQKKGDAKNLGESGAKLLKISASKGEKQSFKNNFAVAVVGAKKKRCRSIFHFLGGEQSLAIMIDGERINNSFL